MSCPLRMGFLASGNGSGLRALYEARLVEGLQIDPRVVISNRPNAPVFAFAEAEGIASHLVCSATHLDSEQRDLAIRDILVGHEVELVFLVGYLALVGPETLRAFPNRILNIHPALLPKFGGKGMFGINVHKAVIESGERESGITIHLSNEVYDKGRILAQCRVVVLPDDTPEALQARVQREEKCFIVEFTRELVNRGLDILDQEGIYLSSPSRK